MKPIFIFIIIISIVVVYFVFFNKGTETYKCVNDTKIVNKFGLLPVPCLVTGLSLDETTAYINNLNNVMKDRNQIVSEADQQSIKNSIETNGIYALTTDEQKVVTIYKLSFALASMSFSNGWDGINNKYIIKKNDNPTKYTQPDNIKTVVSGLQKQIYNTNIYLKNLYAYIDKQDKLTDQLASTAATFINMYIFLNNILNFIQTH